MSELFTPEYLMNKKLAARIAPKLPVVLPTIFQKVLQSMRFQHAGKWQTTRIIGFDARTMHTRPFVLSADLREEFDSDDLY